MYYLFLSACLFVSPHQGHGAPPQYSSSRYLPDQMSEPNQRRGDVASSSLNGQQPPHHNSLDFPSSFLANKVGMQHNGPLPLSLTSEERFFYSEGSSKEDSDEEVVEYDEPTLMLDSDLSHSSPYYPSTPLTPASLAPPGVTNDLNPTPYRNWLSNSPNSFLPLPTPSIHHRYHNPPPFLDGDDPESSQFPGDNHPNGSSFVGGVNYNPASALFPPGYEF